MADETTQERWRIWAQPSEIGCFWKALLPPGSVAIETNLSAVACGEVVAAAPTRKRADQIVHAFNAFEPMRAAIEAALEWYGRPDESALDRFERHAEQFYREHGMLAPGKSEPMEMGTSTEREEERRKLWHEWCARRFAEVGESLAVAMRAADGEGQTP